MPNPLTPEAQWEAAFNPALSAICHRCEAGYSISDAHQLPSLCPACVAEMDRRLDVVREEEGEEFHVDS